MSQITVTDRDEFLLIVAGLVRDGLLFEAHRDSYGNYIIALSGGY